MEELALLIFKWHLQLEDPLKLNVSSLLYHALRWKPNLRNLNRLDTNAVMLNVFRQKGYASTGIFALLDVIHIFDEKAIDLIKSEKSAGCYKSKEIDDIIRNIILIIRNDLKEAQLIIAGLQRKKSVSTTALYFIINQTAAKALKHKVKWAHYLTMNALIDDLSYRGDMPLDEWLLNSDMGFDERTYKKELEREKDRRLNNKMNRQAVNSLQNWSKTIHLPSSRNAESFKTKSKMNKGSRFNSIMKDVKLMLNVHSPNVNWDKDYCVFFNHPQSNCKFNEKCKRHHKCPICNESHPISECPQISSSSND